jgi:hypothetical protein
VQDAWVQKWMCAAERESVCTCVSRTRPEIVLVAWRFIAHALGLKGTGHSLHKVLAAVHACAEDSFGNAQCSSMHSHSVTKGSKYGTHKSGDRGEE